MASERSPDRGSDRRRGLVALACALLVHALAFTWMLTRPASEQAIDKPIVVELREITPPPRPHDPVVVPPPPPPPQRPQKHKAPTKQQRIARPAPPAAAPSARPDLPQSPDAGGKGSGTGGLAQGDGAQPHGAAPEDVELFDEGALEKSVSRWKAQEGEGTGNGLGGLLTGGVGGDPGAGRGAGEGDGEGPEAEKARVSGRIARDIDDIKAADRVRAGLVDPYFKDLRFGFKDEWKPTAEMMGGSDESVGGKVRNMLKAWSATGGQFARTGSPYKQGEGPAGLAEVPIVRPINGTSGFDALDFATRWNAGDFAFSGGLVVLQLVQDPQGRPVEVRVLKSSGFASFDESAKEAVQRVAQVRIAPSHGLGLGGPHIRSVWQLEARMVPQTGSLPPDPTGGFGMPTSTPGAISGGAGFLPGFQAVGTFDLGGQGPEASTPGAMKIVTKIELLGIFGGETQPHDPAQDSAE